MKRDLRIVFMGTPDFAVESLKCLHESKYTIVAVVTAPDKPAGRGQKLQMSPVKKFALEHNLPVLQPKNLKSKDFLKELEALSHNLQVIVAFRMLPEVVFTMPEFGSFNLHGSLLPQYRGAAPIHWAVINGETETGVTTFFLKKEIDTGEILLQQKISIGQQDTTGLVYNKLMKLGAELVVDTCDLIAEAKEQPIPQAYPEGSLKPAPKIFKKDCEIDWNNSTEDVYNFIRGMNPYPTAFTRIEQKLLKIFFGEKEIQDHEFEPGFIQIQEKSELKFATKDGWISCTDVQLEGKKRMPVTNFLQGFTHS